MEIFAISNGFNIYIYIYIYIMIDFQISDKCGLSNSGKEFIMYYVLKSCASRCVLDAHVEKRR